MNNLQMAIIYGSTMGSILSEYHHREQSRAISQIRGDIRKMMYRRSRSNKKEFMEAVTFADDVWRKAVNHFAKNKISIEAIRTSCNLYAAAPNELKRFANISQKKIDALENSSGNTTSLDIEMSSHDVSDYIINAVNEALGIQRDNLLKGMVEHAKAMKSLKEKDAILEAGL